VVHVEDECIGDVIEVGAGWFGLVGISAVGPFGGGEELPIMDFWERDGFVVLDWLLLALLLCLLWLVFLRILQVLLIHHL